MWSPSRSTARTAPAEKKKHAKVIHEHLHIDMHARMTVNVNPQPPESVPHLCDFNVIMRGGFTQASQVGVITATIRKQITAEEQRA